jgi:hypothetical protein
MDVGFFHQGEAYGASIIPFTICAIGGVAFRFGW